MAADGSIVIETNIDNKKAQKELNQLAKKIQSLEDQLTSKKQGEVSFSRKPQRCKCGVGGGQEAVIHAPGRTECYQCRHESWFVR